VASDGFSQLLALAIAFAGRAPANRNGSACADPADEHREPALGSAAHSGIAIAIAMSLCAEFAPWAYDGELLKLGFEVAQSSVAKYMVKWRGPPSQGWRTFLRNHAPEVAAMDLFVVPTIGFDLLYAFIIIRLDRRELVWINVTANPTAEWIAQQITEAFPWNELPHFGRAPQRPFDDGSN
jgi:hypothetical protein